MPKRLIAIGALFSALAGAQTLPILQPHQTFTDGSGAPCTGCSLYSYSAGTTTPKATYSDQAGTPNTNPVVLDVAGGANVWMGSNPYKFVLKDAAANTIWTVDNVPGAAGSATLALILPGWTATGSGGAQVVTAPGTFAAPTLTATTALSAPVLTLSGTGCGVGTYAKADGTGCGSAQSTQFAPDPNFPNLQSFLGSLQGYCNLTGPCNINIFGTSLEVCYGTSGNYNCSTWVGPDNAADRQGQLLRKYVQNLAGNHGSGLVPMISDCSGPTINAEYWSTSGSWTTDSALGPYMTSGCNSAGVVKLAAGSSATFTTGSQAGDIYNSDALAVYCESQPGSAAPTVTIDGVSKAALSACGSGTTSAHVIGYTALAPTTHTAVFACPAGTAPCYLYGAQWDLGSTGVQVSVLAVGSSSSEWYGGHPSTEFAFVDLIPEATSLVINAYSGPNDGADGITPTQMAANITALVNHENGLGFLGNTLLVAAPNNTSAYTSGTLAQYVAASLSTAQTLGTNYVNPQAYWGSAVNNTYHYYNLVNYPGLHYSTRGARMIYSVMYGLTLFGEVLPLPNPVTRGLAGPQALGVGGSLNSINANNVSVAAGMTYNSTYGSWFCNQTGPVSVLDETAGVYSFYNGTCGAVGAAPTGLAADVSFDVSGNILATTLSSTQTATLTAQAAAGSSATLSCFTGNTCDPYGGVLGLAVGGTGIAVGDVVKVSWPTAFAHKARCVWNAQDVTAGSVIFSIVPDATTSTTTAAYAYTFTALVTGHTYTLYYQCN